MPSKRGGLAAASVYGNIYVFGGEEPSGTFNNNEKYDPKTNKWTEDIPMPTGRHGLIAAAINDKIYIVGGGPEPGLTVWLILHALITLKKKYENMTGGNTILLYWT